MSTAAPTRDPDAPPRTSGSGAPAPELFACEVCGREFTHRIGLFNHRKTHDVKRGEGPGVEPEIKVQRASKLSQKELAELQEKTAENIRAVGGLLHTVLIGVKVFRLQNPEARFAIPRTRLDLAIPEIDTHLPYVVISRSETAAKVLVDHASENETLLRWIVRINGWFEGGEVGELVGAHVVGAAMSAGVRNPVMGAAAGALIRDVLDQVEQENRQLRHQVQQLQAQMAAAANGRPGDERGAGSG